MFITIAYVAYVCVLTGHSLTLVFAVAGPIGLLILLCGVIYLRTKYDNIVTIAVVRRELFLNSQCNFTFTNDNLK